VAGKSVIVGNYYRLRSTPHYGWAKVLAVLKPYWGVNIHSYPIAQCEWTVDKDASFGLIKYFKVTDLVSV